MREEYGNIGILLTVGLGIGVIVEGGSWLLGDQRGESEKKEVYECGFDAYSDARQEYEVDYYLVGMLLIVFDLEASYIIPWGVSIDKVGSVGYIGMLEFLLELCLGYGYAWKVGGLKLGKVLKERNGYTR